MTDLTNAMTTALFNLANTGHPAIVAREFAETLAAEQAKATPSRGQIAAMVMAGTAANPAVEGSLAAIARSSVEWADALLAELAKPREAAQ